MRAAGLVAYPLEREPESISWVSRRCPADPTCYTPELRLLSSSALFYVCAHSHRKAKRTCSVKTSWRKHQGPVAIDRRKPVPTRPAQAFPPVDTEGPSNKSDSHTASMLHFCRAAHTRT